MLYFIATPIGNLKDISYRAVEILNSVDLIACEDTRHSLTLLNHYGIKKPLISYHKFNEESSSDKIISELLSGKDVAVISDAGTPLVCDPGEKLTKKLIEQNIPFTVVPGACAFVPALILSGLGNGKFYFYGFLPDKKSDIKREVDTLKDLECPIIFYCAPHDLHKTVGYLYEFLGDRKCVAVRELTKIHEERVEFNLKDGYPVENVKGEFVLVLEGGKKVLEYPESVEEHLNLYLQTGMSKMDAVKQVAKDRGVKKNEIYSYFFKD